jgi:exonuclease III
MRDFLIDLDNPLDVFCFQEHKLREGHTGPLKSTMLGAHCIIAAATDGVCAVRNRRVKGGKGGIGLAVYARMKSYLVGEGVLESLRGVWAKFKHPKFGNLGILGVYAPNTAAERTRLWQEIHRIIDTEYKWILVGDLNMIEQVEDRRGGGCHLISGAEKHAWTRLKRKMQLVDTFVH